MARGLARRRASVYTLGMTTSNADKALSLRAAINERAERLRVLRTDFCPTMAQLTIEQGLKRQIRDLEAELSALPLG